ncbi:MAG TPA: diguanylate cyclase [Xanthobacteraceae bacterium]|nr:diguanylate cyclase [Xanthobacteraceae bacterium]
MLSIRARLIVLALVAIAPLMIERVHGLEEARTVRTERANADVIDLARRGAESQRQIIYSVRSLLQIVSRVYAKMPLDSSSCNQYLGDLTTNIPWIRGLSVASDDGRIKCSTQSDALGLNVSDRPYFQTALTARDFALSDYMISRTNDVPSVIATYPVIKDDGSLGGVVMAAINLQWISDLAATAAQHSGAAVLLLDSAGTLVAGSADQEAYIGKRVAGSELARQMLANDSGTITVAGLDGVQRIFAYVRVPWTQARLAVGLDEGAVHAGIDHEIDVAYLQLIAFGLFVLLIAWFGGEQLVVRPIRSLVRTATRFGRGDLHVRASQEPWVAEFAPLAAALDDMAAKLAAREEELQIANQHLDELASLDGLSGLANRRGFDREIEREWQKAAENGKPLALMMVDIDYFKLFNDRYGHVSGDTCLRAVGETLSLVTLEEAVLVARYGGEEFALLLPGLDVNHATALAEEARQAVEDLMIIHAESPIGHVTISVGVQATVPERFQSYANLIEAADRALYDAKRRGRNTVIAAGAPMPLLAAS